MAANLAGMFAQLNQAINANPLATGGGQKLIDMGSQALGTGAQAVGGLMGNPNIDPYSFMTQGAKARQGPVDLAGLDMTTAEGLEKAASIYGRMGDTTNQVAMAQAARTQQMAEEKLRKEQTLRESLVTSANKLNLPDYAEQVATGAVDLAEASEALRKLEVDDMLMKRGAQGRKVVAKRAGISEDQFKELGLGNMDETQFKNFTQGLEGEVKPYQSAAGEPAMIRTNKFGQVWDKDAMQWKPPSEMGLKPAPQLTKVHNVSNKMVDDLAMKGVENFNDLYTRANDAIITMDNIGRNLPLIDNMPTGSLAQVELFARRVGELLGMDYEEAANAEVFQADAGQRVAKEIKAFGAGTGLSDKDREFAEKMAGGNIEVTPAALKRILEIRNKVAVGTVKNFEDTKARTRKALGTQGGILDMYTLRQPATPAGGLSTNAKKYFGTP